VRGPVVVRVEDPLAPYAAGFGAHLVGQGYAPSSAEDQLRLMAHLSRWLAERRSEPAALTPEMVGRFLAARRAGYVKLTSPRALAPVMGYLHGLGVLPEPLTEEPAPVERLLAEYHDYLVRERGLAAGTVRLREQVARLFLDGQPEPLELALQRLEPGEVTAFVLAQCRSGRRGVSWAKTLTSGLRSLLSFLHMEGWVPVPLAPAVPSVAGWRLASLPRALEAWQVERLLASCDRSTVLGRRDFAVLTLLWRLGLRSFEVAGLSLDDIDWRAGELTIRGKGSVCERLPLPDDVGRALVEYLCAGRPRGCCREVFLRARAPQRGISAAGVRSVVHHACDRAGLARVGAHRLRHTVASELLRAGAPLQQIAQVLGHASLASTAIYAKIDRSSLRTLARPWPLEGGVA
jgi:integrase/recombinase XerD